MEEGLRAELKSKKLVMGPEDHADIIAWMRALRGWNKTRKIYEINPYVEVYQFRDNTYGLFSYNCDAAGDPWMYLIVGPEKAMLLDTAFGLGDTKALVDKLSGGKPLVVVNSHAHPDHAFGNCRFDTVYCHEYSVWDLETQDEHLWDYLFDENGNNRWLAFDRKDLPIFKKYKIIGVPDGYVFNLGGDYEVELKWVPGHASGHAMFLDRKGRILYAGDGLCAHISGEGSGKKPGDPYWKYNNMEALMIFRLLQGTGQAFTATCFLTLAADTLPANKFGAGIGIFSMAQAASQAIGPTVAFVPKSRRGAASSTNYVGNDLGNLAGPVVAGLFVELFGYGAMWRLMLFPVLAALVIVVVFKKRINGIESFFKETNEQAAS